jgi:hypothetical protein
MGIPQRVQSSLATSSRPTTQAGLSDAGQGQQDARLQRESPPCNGWHKQADPQSERLTVISPGLWLLLQVINDVTVSEPAGASGVPCCPVTNTLTTVTIDATSQQADMDCNGLKGRSDPPPMMA